MKVLFFAQLRDFTRCAECDLTVANSLSTDELWTNLEQRFPGIVKFRSSTRLARNADFAAADQQFGANDEVALLPPVSGG